MISRHELTTAVLVKRAGGRVEIFDEECRAVLNSTLEFWYERDPRRFVMQITEDPPKPPEGNGLE